MKILPERKPLRLKDYDYSKPGGYYLTICTKDRRNILSKVEYNENTAVGAIHESPVVRLTPIGEIVDRIINNLPPHLGVEVDRYVIMPNHIHIIILVTESRAIRESPLQGRSVISKTVGYIKMNVSKEINRRFGRREVWQSRFYDHIIRDREDYITKARYIYENPARWRLDELYSD